MAENRPYTQPEKDFIAEHAASATTAWIAKRLGRSPGAIRLKMHKMDIKRGRIDRWVTSEIDFLREHYREKGPRWLSETMERTYLAIVTKAKELGVTKK